jgi:hypothetical protein
LKSYEEIDKELLEEIRGILKYYWYIIS